MATLKSVAVSDDVPEVAGVVPEIAVPLRNVVNVLVLAAMEPRLDPRTMWCVPVSVSVTAVVPFSFHDTTE